MSKKRHTVYVDHATLVACAERLNDEMDIRPSTIGELIYLALKAFAIDYDKLLEQDATRMLEDLNILNALKRNEQKLERLTQ